MKRNIRTIIIVAVVLALLVGAYFFVANMKKDEKGETQPITAEQAEYFIPEKLNDIEYIQYNAGEVNYTVYNTNTPSIEGYTSHIIDSAKLESILISTSSMQFDKNMGEQNDLSKYGLDKEDKFIAFKLKNGRERKIIIGNPTHINGEYYVRKSGENVVYTLSAQSSGILMCHPGIFRDTKICVVDNFSISEFTVEKSGEKSLEVKRDEKFALENGFIQSNYIIMHPYNSVEANNDTLNAFFETMTSVYATEIVEENPADLSIYGLDTPNVVSVKDKNGTSTVKMGTYAEDGTVYVMHDDIPVVFKANCPFYESVKNLVADEYVARYVHLFKKNDVEQVVIRKADETHTMKITKKSENSYEYRIDDKIKTEDNFLSAYETLISPIFNKIVNEAITGKEVYEITFTFNDKSKKTFIYHEYDSKNYIVKASNGLTCIVKKESVDEILDAVK